MHGTATAAQQQLHSAKQTSSQRSSGACRTPQECATMMDAVEQAMQQVEECTPDSHGGRASRPSHLQDWLQSSGLQMPTPAARDLQVLVEAVADNRRLRKQLEALREAELELAAREAEEAAFNFSMLEEENTDLSARNAKLQQRIAELEALAAAAEAAVQAQQQQQQQQLDQAGDSTEPFTPEHLRMRATSLSDQAPTMQERATSVLKRAAAVRRLSGMCEEEQLSKLRELSEAEGRLTAVRAQGPGSTQSQHSLMQQRLLSAEQQVQESAAAVQQATQQLQAVLQQKEEVEQELASLRKQLEEQPDAAAQYSELYTKLLEAQQQLLQEKQQHQLLAGSLLEHAGRLSHKYYNLSDDYDALGRRYRQLARANDALTAQLKAAHEELYEAQIAVQATPVYKRREQQHLLSRLHDAEQAVQSLARQKQQLQERLLQAHAFIACLQQRVQPGADMPAGQQHTPWALQTPSGQPARSAEAAAAAPTPLLSEAAGSTALGPSERQLAALPAPGPADAAADKQLCGTELTGTAVSSTGPDSFITPARGHCDVQTTASQLKSQQGGAAAVAAALSGDERRTWPQDALPRNLKAPSTGSTTNPQQRDGSSQSSHVVRREQLGLREEISRAKCTLADIAGQLRASIGDHASPADAGGRDTAVGRGPCRRGSVAVSGAPLAAGSNSARRASSGQGNKSSDAYAVAALGVVSGLLSGPAPASASSTSRGSCASTPAGRPHAPGRLQELHRAAAAVRTASAAKSSHSSGSKGGKPTTSRARVTEAGHPPSCTSGDTGVARASASVSRMGHQKDSNKHGSSSNSSGRSSTSSLGTAAAASRGRASAGAAPAAAQSGSGSAPPTAEGLLTGNSGRASSSAGAAASSPCGGSISLDQLIADAEVVSLEYGVSPAGLPAAAAAAARFEKTSAVPSSRQQGADSEGASNSSAPAQQPAQRQFAFEAAPALATPGSAASSAGAGGLVGRPGRAWPGPHQAELTPEPAVGPGVLLPDMQSCRRISRAKSSVNAGPRFSDLQQEGTPPAATPAGLERVASNSMLNALCAGGVQAPAASAAARDARRQQGAQVATPPSTALTAVAGCTAAATEAGTSLVQQLHFAAEVPAQASFAQAELFDFSAAEVPAQASSAQAELFDFSAAEVPAQASFAQAELFDFSAAEVPAQASSAQDELLDFSAAEASAQASSAQAELLDFSAAEASAQASSAQAELFDFSVVGTLQRPAAAAAAAAADIGGVSAGVTISFEAMEPCRQLQEQEHIELPAVLWIDQSPRAQGTLEPAAGSPPSALKKAAEALLFSISPAELATAAAAAAATTPGASGPSAGGTAPGVPLSPSLLQHLTPEWLRSLKRKCKQESEQLQALRRQMGLATPQGELIVAAPQRQQQNLQQQQQQQQQQHADEGQEGLARPAAASPAAADDRQAAPLQLIAGDFDAISCTPDSNAGSVAGASSSCGTNQVASASSLLVCEAASGKAAPANTNTCSRAVSASGPAVSQSHAGSRSSIDRLRRCAIMSQANAAAAGPAAHDLELTSSSITAATTAAAAAGTGASGSLTPVSGAPQLPALAPAATGAGRTAAWHDQLERTSSAGSLVEYLRQQACTDPSSAASRTGSITPSMLTQRPECPTPGSLYSSGALPDSGRESPASPDLLLEGLHSSRLAARQLQQQLLQQLERSSALPALLPQQHKAAVRTAVGSGLHRTNSAVAAVAAPTAGTEVASADASTAAVGGVADRQLSQCDSPSLAASTQLMAVPASVGQDAGRDIAAVTVEPAPSSHEGTAGSSAQEGKLQQQQHVALSGLGGLAAASPITPGAALDAGAESRLLSPSAQLQLVFDGHSSDEEGCTSSADTRHQQQAQTMADLQPEAAPQGCQPVAPMLEQGHAQQLETQHAGFDEAPAAITLLQQQQQQQVLPVNTASPQASADSSCILVHGLPAKQQPGLEAAMQAPSPPTSALTATPPAQASINAHPLSGLTAATVIASAAPTAAHGDCHSCASGPQAEAGAAVQPTGSPGTDAHNGRATAQATPAASAVAAPAASRMETPAEPLQRSVTGSQGSAQGVGSAFTGSSGAKSRPASSQCASDGVASLGTWNAAGAPLAAGSCHEDQQGWSGTPVSTTGPYLVQAPAAAAAPAAALPAGAPGTAEQQRGPTGMPILLGESPSTKQLQQAQRGSSASSAGGGEGSMRQGQGTPPGEFSGTSESCLSWSAACTSELALGSSPDATEQHAQQPGSARIAGDKAQAALGTAADATAAASAALAAAFAVPRQPRSAAGLPAGLSEQHSQQAGAVVPVAHTGTAAPAPVYTVAAGASAEAAAAASAALAAAFAVPREPSSAAGQQAASSATWGSDSCSRFATPAGAFDWIAAPSASASSGSQGMYFTGLQHSAASKPRQGWSAGADGAAAGAGDIEFGGFRVSAPQGSAAESPRCSSATEARNTSSHAAAEGAAGALWAAPSTATVQKQLLQQLLASPGGSEAAEDDSIAPPGAGPAAGTVQQQGAGAGAAALAGELGASASRDHPAGAVASASAACSAPAAARAGLPPTDVCSTAHSQHGCGGSSAASEMSAARRILQQHQQQQAVRQQEGQQARAPSSSKAAAADLDGLSFQQRLELLCAEDSDGTREGSSGSCSSTSAAPSPTAAAEPCDAVCSADKPAQAQVSTSRPDSSSSSGGGRCSAAAAAAAAAGVEASWALAAERPAGGAAVDAAVACCGTQTSPAVYGLKGPGCMDWEAKRFKEAAVQVPTPAPHCMQAKAIGNGQGAASSVSPRKPAGERLLRPCDVAASPIKGRDQC